MTKRMYAVGLSLILLVCSGCNRDNRYQLVSVDSGICILDTHTGSARLWASGKVMEFEYNNPTEARVRTVHFDKEQVSDKEAPVDSDRLLRVTPPSGPAADR